MRYIQLLENDLLDYEALHTNKEYVERISRQVIQAIKEECKPFLQASEGRTLYRGLYSDEALIVKKKVRLDRKPTDSMIQFHQFYNRVFARMGFSTNRSNSMFCTGNAYMANDYGNSYVVFPIGIFDFLWSPQIKDMTNTFQDNGEYVIDDNSDDIEFDWDAMEGIIKASYTNKNLPSAIDSGHEIMISGCTEYYAIHHELWEQFKKWFNE